MSSAEASTPTWSPVGEELIRVTLTEGNKDLLLREAPRQSEQRAAEAEAIWARMKKSCPEVDRDFDLKGTAISKAPLKLVCSKKSCITADPPGVIPSYVAISYCWRSDSWDAQGIAEPYGEWPISAAMVQCLMQLRDSEDEGIWIDQLCIDQRNSEEKLLAIGSMDIIYRSARRLIIVLEDVQLSPEEEMVVVKYKTELIRNLDYLGWRPSDAEKKMLSQVFLKIVSARWFSRAWCGHEFRVVSHWSDRTDDQNMVVMFSSHGIALRMPVLLLTIISSLVQDMVMNSRVKPIKDMAAQQTVNARWLQLAQRSHIQRELQPSNSPAASLMAQFAFATLLGCSVPGDRISIAINLSGIGIYYKGVADTDDECQYACTVLALAAGDVAVFGLEGQKLRLSRDGATRTSWIQRPLNISYACDELRFPPFPGPTAINRITPYYIELDLLVLKDAPRGCSPTYLTHAASLLSSADANNSPSLKQWQSRVRSLSRSIPGLLLNTLWRRLVDLLASALAAGPAWMRVAWPLIDADIVQPEWSRSGGFSPDPALRPAALEVLAREGLSPDSTPDFEPHQLRPVLALLSFLLDPRVLALLRWPAHVVTGSATSARGITHLVDPRFVLAVPAALSQHRFVTSRVWVLERVEEQAGPRYRLVDKAPLLGAPDLVADGEAIVLEKGVKVQASDVEPRANPYLDQLAPWMETVWMPRSSTGCIMM